MGDMLQAAGERLRAIGTAAMIALAAAEVAYLVGGIEPAGALGRALTVIVVVCLVPRFGFREWALLALALGLAAGTLLYGDEGAITAGLDTGAFFAGFILLITLLREAAITSPAVLALGHYLTRQQPGRRLVAIFTGGHLLGVLMNFTAISLMAPLVQRGVRAEPVITEEDKRRVQIRERRALSALIRGFGLVVCWSPTSLAQAVILSVVPGVSHGRIMALGVGFATLLLGVAWAEDRLRWGKPRARAPGLEVPRFPKVAARDLLIVALALLGGAYLARGLFGVTMAPALMAMAPFLLVGWVFTQNLEQGAPAAVTAVRRRLVEIVTGPFPSLTRDAYLLGVAGFIGTTAGLLAPVEAIAAALAIDQMPTWVFLSVLPMIVIASGNIALSPLMMVVFLAAVIRALPELPADPNLIAFSLGAGWGLSMTGSPNATGPILLAGITGLPSTTLTWRWNGVYSLAGLVLLVGLFYVFA